MAGATASATCVLVFLLLLLLRTASSSNTTFFSCSPKDAVPPNGTYQANLRSLLSSLPSASAPYRFANLSLGSPPDRVFGLGLCRGDTNSSVCLSCLTFAASEALHLCPGSLSAAVFYDLCRLRFSSTRFFSTLTPAPVNPYLFAFDQVADPDYFRHRVGTLLARLRDRAAFGNGTGFYSSGWAEYTQETTLFGLVQCTRDLSDVMCAQCLEEPIRTITCCRRSVQIAYQGGSCYLRYAFYLFFNGSVLAPPPLPRPRVAANASADVGGAPTAPPHRRQHRGKHNFIAMVVGIVAGGTVLFVLVALIAVRMKRRRRRGHILLGRRNMNDENIGLMFGRLSLRKLSFQVNPRGLGSQSFDTRKLGLQIIKAATDNFSDSKKVAKGEFGPVYKGELPGLDFIAKRITAIPRVEVEVIKREFKSFTKLEHPNLAKLLTFHLGEENLLVHEYLPNDSLDRVLFDNKRKVLLDWGRRFKIIQGIAQGLLYLQGDSGLNLIHQNLKASKILLDRHMAPKISGFCLPKFFTACDSTNASRKSSSRSGYMAPETFTNGIYTSKTDVYSFGVLVLEIITGQKNRALLGSDNAITLLNYVWQYWKDEKAVQVLDWSLGELYKKHEVLRCIHVGLLCIQEDPEKRPGVSAIVHMLSSFSFTPSNPSPPAIIQAGKSNQQPKDDSSGTSGDWDLKFGQATGRVTPR